MAGQFPAIGRPSSPTAAGSIASSTTAAPSDATCSSAVMTSSSRFSTSGSAGGGEYIPAPFAVGAPLIVTTLAKTADVDSLSSGDSGSVGGRFRRAVCRVLIALSFKSFRRRNETNRRRERSDCSEARFLPIHAGSSSNVDDYVAGGSGIGPEVSAGYDQRLSADVEVVYGGTVMSQTLYHAGSEMIPVCDEQGTAEAVSGMPRRGRREAVYDPKTLGRVSAPDGGDASPTNSCDEADTSGPTALSNNDEPSGDLVDHQMPRFHHPGSGSSSSAVAVMAPALRRKRSSADLGINYPGDLLSLVRPRSACVSAARSGTSTSGSTRRLAMSGAAGGSGRGRRAPPPLLKRNTIGDFASTNAYIQGVAGFGTSTVSGGGTTAGLAGSGGEQEKKLKRTFSLLKLKKSHRSSKDNLPDLSEVLQCLKQSEFKDSYLARYKDAHWMDVLAGKIDDVSTSRIVDITETERKRREAVWELFKSECVFLIDHLMALKHCFMEPMKKVQVEGHLMFAEPHDLFGNLDELCYVSYTFSRDFISLLVKDGQASTDFGRTEVLIKGLRRFCQLTRDGEVYHDYCLNYSKAMTYLERLRKNEDFCEFEKWCEQDDRCHRLQLNDLLISPMQHCTKVPLLLNNIRRYTEDPREQQLLTISLQKLETSLQNLEAKMKWLRNFERVQELQQQILWRPITELEPRAFIPEFLRATLSRQPCDRLLSSPQRHLLHEGPVTLLEISKTIDMYLFLFDDILLLTRVKKASRKKSNTSTDTSPYAPPKVHTDGAVFVVHRQPIALDRMTVHDVRQDLTGVVDDVADCGGDSIDSSSPLQQPVQLQTSSSLQQQQQPHFIVSTPVGAADTSIGQQAHMMMTSSSASALSPSSVMSCSASASAIIGVPCMLGQTSSSPPSQPPAILMQQQQQQQQQPLSPDSDGGAPTDWCLPHFVDECPGQRGGANLLFGCLSAANGDSALKNAFVIVQFNQFQQIIGVFTLQAPSEACKTTWLARLCEAQEHFNEAMRATRFDSSPIPSASGPKRAFPPSSTGTDAPGRLMGGGEQIGPEMTGFGGRTVRGGSAGGQINITIRPCDIGTSGGMSKHHAEGAIAMLIDAETAASMRKNSNGGDAALSVTSSKHPSSLSVPGFEDDGYGELTDDSQDSGAPGRRIRSSSSDAVVVTSGLLSDCACVTPELRRISDPICHSSARDFALDSSTSSLAGSDRNSNADRRRLLPNKRLDIQRDAVDDGYSDDGIQSPPQPAAELQSPQPTTTSVAMVDDLIAADATGVAGMTPSGLYRRRQTSLRVRRRGMLKSIHEKSQSIDTC